MRCSGLSRLLVLLALAGTAGVAQAQQAEPTTREGAIAQAQAEKSKTLTPYVPNKGERIAGKFENILTGQGRHLHPFLESAYSGGGFAFGAGYLQHVSPFNYVDVRGSYSLSNYKRAEVEFVAPKTLPPPRPPVPARRLSRGDTGQVLRHRDQLAGRRARELRP